jgi:hypothetical protein
LAVSGSMIFAAAEEGVFRSSDDGATWTEVTNGLSDPSVHSIAVVGSTIFAGTTSGVFQSSDNGANWRAVNTGLTSDMIFALAVSKDFLFAGTVGFGVWKRPLAEMVTSVNTLSIDVPAQFALSQNYPNPFNPSTTISFSLPSKSLVTMKIFDVMGREVSTVVSEEMPPGNYSRLWNASGFASGVYFYRIQAGAYVETKRLVIMK